MRSIYKLKSMSQMILHFLRNEEFSASISVEAINATGTLTSVEGGPIGITVFDNDCKFI